MFTLFFQTWWQWAATWMVSTMRMEKPSSPAPSISAHVLLEPSAAPLLSSRSLLVSWALPHWWATCLPAFAAIRAQGSTSRTPPTCQVCLQSQPVEKAQPVWPGMLIAVQVSWQAKGEGVSLLSVRHDWLWLNRSQRKMVPVLNRRKGDQKVSLWCTVQFVCPAWHEILQTHT